MPLINNAAFVLAIIGLIFGVIALVVNRKNKKTLALVATILSVVSVVVVLVTQSMYSSALDSAANLYQSQLVLRLQHLIRKRLTHLNGPKLITML